MIDRTIAGPTALVAMALLIALQACHGGTPLGPGPELQGSWGGTGFGLEVFADSAFARFDCAYGRPETPIRLDDTGRFAVGGDYVREVGPASLPNPAQYQGRVTGNSIELTVVITDTISGTGSGTLGPFTGKRDGQPLVVYCQ